MTVFTKAICFAAERHEGQRRKETETPYIVHPLEAAAIAATITSDEEILAAAVLHDVAEDCGVTREELILRFGERVAALVAADSEDKREGLPPESTWKLRKQETLVQIQKMDRAERLIVLSDKLSNMRAICRDHICLGDRLWERFHCKDKAEQAWYYRSICDALRSDFEQELAWQELSGLINRVFASEM